MSNFNTSTKGKNTTTNSEGFKAYKASDKETLITQVLTTMIGEKKFYGDNTSELVQNAIFMAKIDPKFVANLAIVARKEFHMRSVFHVLTSILAAAKEGKQYVRSVCKFIERPDDIVEIISCYEALFGKGIPAQLKKGLADSFSKFNEYSLAKYKHSGKAIPLSLAMRLCHPKPVDEHRESLYKRLLEKKLETPYTWETELSKKGNTKETWEQLIESGKVGYMALLRNMNNIIKSGASNVDIVFEKIANKDVVLKNKQLPFRFYSAYTQLKKDGNLSAKAFTALSRALEYSIANMEQIKGNTIVAVDVSVSMQTAISKKSEVLCSEISCLFAAMAEKLCERCTIVAFDTRIKKVKMLPSLGIIENAEKINVNGGGTDISLATAYAAEHDGYDRLILFSDNEANSQFSSSEVMEHVHEILEKNPNFYFHAIDLMGYGTQQVIGKNVNIIAGWSEAIFKFIGLFESGAGGIVKDIEGKYIQ